MTDSNGNLVERVLSLLRSGYSKGVPQDDYVALFAIPRRALTEAEIEESSRRLTTAADDPRAPITHAHIHAVISRNVLESPSDADTRRVAGRLAEGGWPRASPLDQEQSLRLNRPHSHPWRNTAATLFPHTRGRTPQVSVGPRPSARTGAGTSTRRHLHDEIEVTMPTRLQRVVNWLRAGYPHGIPDGDFVPLFALLRRRLTEDEARDLAAELVDKGLITPDKIDVAVEYLRITNELPSQDEIARVITHLRANGWEIRDEPLTDGNGPDDDGGAAGLP